MSSIRIRGIEAKYLVKPWRMLQSRPMPSVHFKESEDSTAARLSARDSPRDSISSQERLHVAFCLARTKRIFVIASVACEWGEAWG